MKLWSFKYNTLNTYIEKLIKVYIYIYGKAKGMGKGLQTKHSKNSKILALSAMWKHSNFILPLISQKIIL